MGAIAEGPLVGRSARGVGNTLCTFAVPSPGLLVLPYVMYLPAMDKCMGVEAAPSPGAPWHSDPGTEWRIGLRVPGVSSC